MAVYPDLGSHARKKLVGSKGERTSYSSGVLTEGIRMWGHLRWPWNRKSETSFHPLVCIFHSVGPAPLFPHPPPACLVIQEEEAKESNIVLKIGLEGQ